jgi:ribosomal subunit interface protein
VDRTERVSQLDTQLEIVVKGRRAEVTERFREHVREKLSRLERLDAKAYRIDVEVGRESNPRQTGMRDRVELTLRSRGPVVRAEAAAQDPYGALDIATAKLEERMRRAADRRRTRHQAGPGAGGHPPNGHGLNAREDAGALEAAGLAEVPDLPPIVPGGGAPAADPVNGGAPQRADGSTADVDDDDRSEDDVLLAAGPLVVREKAHDATPMTLDDALHRMELVGHDFYLFCDADTGLPSVVYRRRGYTYGVLRLRAGVDAAS